MEWTFDLPCIDLAGPRASEREGRGAEERGVEGKGKREGRGGELGEERPTTHTNVLVLLISLILSPKLPNRRYTFSSKTSREVEH